MVLRKYFINEAFLAQRPAVSRSSSSQRYSEWKGQVKTDRQSRCRKGCEVAVCTPLQKVRSTSVFISLAPVGTQAQLMAVLAAKSAVRALQQGLSSDLPVQSWVELRVWLTCKASARPGAEWQEIASHVFSPRTRSSQCLSLTFGTSQFPES